MWCSCYMMSSVLESSTKFFQVSWSVLWLCYQVVTDVTAWPINPNPSCSKNRKIKQNENKNKEWNRKTKSTVYELDIYNRVWYLEKEERLREYKENSNKIWEINKCRSEIIRKVKYSREKRL